jgi:hypothetical protein
MLNRCSKASVTPWRRDLHTIALSQYGHTRFSVFLSPPINIEPTLSNTSRALANSFTIIGKNVRKLVAANARRREV